MNSGLMTNSPNDSCTVKMNRLSAVGCKDTMSFGSQLEVIVHFNLLNEWLNSPLYEKNKF